MDLMRDLAPAQGRSVSRKAIYQDIYALPTVSSLFTASWCDSDASVDAPHAGGRRGGPIVAMTTSVAREDIAHR